MQFPLCSKLSYEKVALVAFKKKLRNSKAIENFVAAAAVVAAAAAVAVVAIVSVADAIAAATALIDIHDFPFKWRWFVSKEFAIDPIVATLLTAGLQLSLTGSMEQMVIVLAEVILVLVQMMFHLLHKTINFDDSRWHLPSLICWN